MDQSENERQYGVVDQTLSMHSMLRDKYAQRAFFLKTGVLSASIALCAFVFAGDRVLALIGAEPELARVGFGLASVVLLILSIVELRVDWESRSAKHSHAAQQLAKLKAKYRRLHSDTNGEDASKNARLGRDYERTMDSITPIPEAWLIPLKASHLYKRLLSQRISKQPKAPVWFLGLQLRWEGIRDPKARQQGDSDVSGS